MSTDHRPGGARRPARDPRAEVKKRAQELAREAGLPPNLAHQVAMGNLQLPEVLERLAQRDRIEALITRHELPRSLATQIVLGQADLEQVLLKRRQDAHLAEHRERSMLLDAQASGALVSLGAHGQRQLHGRVLDVGRYELRLQPVDPKTGAAGAPEEVHKLQLKWGGLAEAAKICRNQLRWDKERKAAAEPLWRPQDRYGCADRRLYGLLDEGALVQATLLEGEVLRGSVTWVGRWEFGMDLKKKGATCVVFRHALADLRRA
jgi:sRNA-binding regulator protein Hfq